MRATRVYEEEADMEIIWAWKHTQTFIKIHSFNLMAVVGKIVGHWFNDRNSPFKSHIIDFGCTLLLLRMENKCRKCPTNKSQNLYQFFSNFTIFLFEWLLLRLHFNIEIEFHRNQEREQKVRVENVEIHFCKSHVRFKISKGWFFYLKKNNLIN